jgi:hypothetical protein
MAVARYLHTATLLKNGQVLVAGGFDGITGAALDSAELYDPAQGTWMPAAPMNEPHGWPSATVLKNGRVLIAGGYGTNGIVPSAELYDTAGHSQISR